MRSNEFNRDTEKCRWHQTLRSYMVPSQIRNNRPTIKAQTSHVQLISGQTYLAVVHIDVGLYYDLLRVSIITRNVDMGQRRPPYIGFGEFSHHWPPLSRRDELENREEGISSLAPSLFSASMQ